MKVGILSIGHVDTELMMRIGKNLGSIFPDTTCKVIIERLPLREEALDKKRNQYRSTEILGEFKATLPRVG